MAQGNRIYVSTATVGTGTLTLGAVVSGGFCTFAEAGIADGATVRSYVIEEGSDFEIGYGVYNSAGPTLTRAVVRLSRIGGTAGTTKMTLAGNAKVRVIAAKEDLVTQDENSNVNIGTALAPDSKLTINANTVVSPGSLPSTTYFHLVGADGVVPRLVIDSFATANVYVMRRAGGTAAVPTALAADDEIGAIAGYGYDGTAYSASARAWMWFNAAQNWTSSAHGTYINFATTPNGTTANAEVLRIHNSGGMVLGDATAVLTDPGAHNMYIGGTLRVIGAIDASVSGIVASTVRSLNLLGSTSNGGVQVIFRTTSGVGLGDQYLFSGGSNGGTTFATMDSNGLAIGTGQAYKIGGANVLNTTALGSSVVSSSLTSLGTITSLVATSLTNPLHIGGSGTTGTQLTLQTTSGVGTTDQIAFVGGNNGATTFATMSGSVFAATGQLSALNGAVGNSLNQIDIGKNWSSTNGANLIAVFTSYSDQSRFVIRRAAGTMASYSAISSGDNIGTIAFRGAVAANSFLTNNSAQIQCVSVDNFTSTAQGAKLTFNTTPAGTVATATGLTVQDSGNIQFNKYGAGTLTTDASGNITATSDETLKFIRGYFVPGMEALRSINPILYSWRRESGNETMGVYAGFSAQNVQPSIPEAVGRMGRKLTLQDRPMIATIVNALKQIDARVALLEAA